jgi:hypothetical protein
MSPKRLPGGVVKDNTVMDRAKAAMDLVSPKRNGRKRTLAHVFDL